MLASIESTSYENETVVNALVYAKIASIIPASDKVKDSTIQTNSSVINFMAAGFVPNTPNTKKTVTTEEKK